LHVAGRRKPASNIRHQRAESGLDEGVFRSSNELLQH
jgi:hypothetical protein